MTKGEENNYQEDEEFTTAADLPIIYEEFNDWEHYVIEILHETNTAIDKGVLRKIKHLKFYCYGYFDTKVF